MHFLWLYSKEKSSLQIPNTFFSHICNWTWENKIGSKLKGIKLSCSLTPMKKGSLIFQSPWGGNRTCWGFWVRSESPVYHFHPPTNPRGSMNAKSWDVWHSLGPNFPVWKGMENTSFQVTTLIKPGKESPSTYLGWLQMHSLSAIS
jgi:hypothetical protein